MEQKQRLKRTPREQLDLSLHYPLFRDIFSEILNLGKEVRQKEISEILNRYSVSSVGNYMRRAEQRGILKKRKDGSAVYYSFADDTLKSLATEGLAKKAA